MTLAGVHFRYTSTTWTDNSWSALGATELAAMIWVWIVMTFGLVALCIGSTCCLATLFVGLLLCFIFTFAIAIWVFIGTQTTYWNEAYGCDTKYKGFLEAWGSVDIYLQAVDELFCSYKCPCYVNRTTAQKFLYNYTAAPYYNLWSTFNISIKPHRFQDCNVTETEAAYGNYLMRNAYYNNSFRQDWFHTYFTHVEEYFECTGFCSTTYFNTITGTNAKMVKYLFTDIAKGVPKYIGCLEPILDWVTKTLNAFAAVCLFLVVILILFILIIIKLLAISFQEKNEIVKSRKKAKDENQVSRDKAEEEKPKEDTHKEGKKVTNPNKEDDIIITENIFNTSFKPSDSQLQEKEIEFNPSIMKP